MFIKPLNNNQLDFIENLSDEKETVIHTTHFSVGDYLVFPNSIPIDVQCKYSENTNKEFCLVYSNSRFLGVKGEIIITINTPKGKYTIPLSCSRDELVPQDKPFHDIKHFFPISEEAFKFCCNASSIELEINEDNGTRSTKENGEELIDLCKLLYQEVFDNKYIQETESYLQRKKDELNQLFEKLQSNK